MSVLKDETVEKLLESYSSILSRKNACPEWAVHKTCNPNSLISCSIPFVGIEYKAQPQKLLVYASAENLSTYYEKDGGWLDDDRVAINRHRFWLEKSSPKDFFPNVHINPMNNGCLSIAAFYYALKYLNINAQKPADFYERICFGNYCKYSVETDSQLRKRVKPNDTVSSGQLLSKVNVDYAGDAKKLMESREFIRVDFETLKPDYVLMPKAIYTSEREFVDAVKGHATIIPIMQINVGNINRHLKTCVDYRPRLISSLHPTIREWYDKLDEYGTTGKSKENYLCVFNYLDSVVKAISDGGPS